MSDIDKDIEILEELITHKDDYDVAYGYRFEKPCQIGSEKINAVENVLADRETWKKMAEKLAERVKKESFLDSNCYVGGLKICKGNKDCQQCILDWARNEVDK